MTNDWEADERADRPRPPQLDDVIDRVLDEGVVIESEVQVSVLDIELLGVSSQVFVRGLDWDSDAARPALSGWLRHGSYSA
jgi:hypothetical protein